MIPISPGTTQDIPRHTKHDYHSSRSEDNNIVFTFETCINVQRKANVMAIPATHCHILWPSWLRMIQNIGGQLLKPYSAAICFLHMPVSPSILRNLKAVWQAWGQNSDTIKLSAATCLGFFAFLRAGEMIVSSDTWFDPDTLHHKTFQ